MRVTREKHMSHVKHDWAVGRPAPGLSLPLAAGGSVSLGDYAGRPVLVSFLSHAA